MALRVLLADESSTIKKVFQLALQDFAVEVRPVNIGVDVLTVAKSFQPDIVFADVLLQKKNGYDVCAELKSDASLAKVPVVLMWSGFMELDEDKYQAASANGQLEKPFDVAALRKLVSELVPKTGSQRLSQFLSFPKMPELEEKQPKTPTAPKAPDEEFQQVPIPKMKSGADRFRIQIDKDEDVEMPVTLNMPSDAINEEPEEFMMRETKARPGGPQAPPNRPAPQAPPNRPAPQAKASPPVPPPLKPTPQVAATIPQLTEAQVEEIIRSQSKEIIEAAVWRILPELAQQIIEREIAKLLKEKDAGIYR